MNSESNQEAQKFEEQKLIWQTVLKCHCDWRESAKLWANQALEANLEILTPEQISLKFFKMWKTYLNFVNKYVGSESNKKMIDGIQGEQILKIIEAADNQKNPKSALYQLLMELLTIACYCQVDSSLMQHNILENCPQEKFEQIMGILNTQPITVQTQARQEQPQQAIMIQYDSKVKMSGFKDIYIKIDLNEDDSKKDGHYIQKKAVLNALDEVLKKRQIDYWSRILIRSNLIHKLMQA